MKKIFITIVIIVSILLSLTFVLACEENETGMQSMMGNNIAGGWMMYGMYGGYGADMMLFSWITWFLVVILIIAAIYWLVKSANKKK